MAPARLGETRQAALWPCSVGLARYEYLPDVARGEQQQRKS